MNRRGFLKGAIKAAGLAAIGSSILPSVVRADSPSPTIDISEIDGLEGGYIVPYDMEALIRRDFAEAIARDIDRNAIKEGWEPQGGISIGLSVSQGHTYSSLAQAMIKK